LLALEVGGRLYFPDWQFGPEGPRAGLGQVLEALSAEHRGVLAADALMRTALPEAGGRSAADLLAAGDIDAAVHYVRAAGG
jgi:riboflavin biosynthesis pyrimidine reductase